MNFNEAFNHPKIPKQQKVIIPECPKCNKLQLTAMVCNNGCNTYTCSCGYIFFVKFGFRFHGHYPLCGLI